MKDNTVELLINEYAIEHFEYNGCDTQDERMGSENDNWTQKIKSYRYTGFLRQPWLAPFTFSLWWQ